jgi:DNA-binding FrmR family transcriptional regulator
MEARDKSDLGTRLKKISGQITGLQRMVDDNRALVDLITQVSAVRAALRSVTNVLLASHVEERASGALTTESVRERREFVNELVRLVRMRDA